MAVDTMKVPGQPEPDPQLAMGHALLAQERRERLIKTIKIGIVWVILIIILIFALLQFNFDPAYVLAHYGFVLVGLPLTIGISIASILAATVLALLGAVAKLSNNSIAQGVAGLYVSLVRGTPLLVQIFIIYNGLPQIGTALMAKGLPFGHYFILSAIESGILALSLNYGAYMTEIFRAGIQSISGGQREAAESIGMNRVQILRRIILPRISPTSSLPCRRILPWSPLWASGR
jgi:polar amino acid transport system permease protein